MENHTKLGFVARHSIVLVTMLSPLIATNPRSFEICSDLFSESLKIQADPGSQLHLKTWNSVIHINVGYSAVQCILLCIPNHFLELCSMRKRSHKKRCLMTSLMSEQGIVTRLSDRDPFKVFADNFGTTQLLNPNLTASASRLSMFPTSLSSPPRPISPMKAIFRSTGFSR